MRSFRGNRSGRTPYRGKSNGRRRPTRRAGSRVSKGRNWGRIGMGIGIAGAGLLAVNAGILGAAGTSRAIKELHNTAKSIGKWAKTRGARKAAAQASTVAFHTARVTRLSKYRSKTMKFKKMKVFSPRRMVKR